jgi:hypothetical protein
VIHDGRGRAGRAFRFVLIMLILLSSALIALEFLEGGKQYMQILAVLEGIVVGLFTLEYLLRIYSAPDRLKYVFSFFGIVDILSIVPFYAGLFGSPFIRLLLLIRLAKLGEIDASAKNEDVTEMRKTIDLMAGESVEYVVSKSPIALFLGAITPLVALTFGLGLLLINRNPASIAAGCSLLLFALVFLWKTWLDYSYDVIYVTTFRLIFQDQHLFGRSINQVSFNAITNVKPFYPNPLSFILRYGSLIIDTAAEHPGQIELHTVRRHEQAAHRIMQKTFQSQPAPAHRSA